MTTLGLIRLAVRYALGFPLWGDEAFLAINFLVRDFQGLSEQLEFGQVAPPGFLWAEWGVAKVLGVSEWALRLLPFLAGIVSLLLFRRFCRQVSGGIEALLAVAFFATSYYPIRHAAEVKPYATDLLFSLTLVSIGWGVWNDPGSRKRQLALIGVMTAGVWCSYTAIFPAAAVGLLMIVLAWRQRSNQAMAFVLVYATLLAGNWLVMIITFAEPQARETSWLINLTTWQDAFPPLDRPWRLPDWLLRVHTGNALAYPYGGNDFGSTLTFLLVVRGSFALWRRRERRPLLLLLLGPIPVALVAAALHRYPYGTSARTMLYMAPAFCFLAGTGLAAVLRSRLSFHKSVVWSVLIASLMGLIPVCGVIVDCLMPYKSQDDLANRQLIRTLADQARPGDQWIVFNGSSPPTPAPDLMIQQWLQQVAEVRFYITRWVPAPVYWEPDPSRVKAVRGRTWFIVHQPGQTEYPYERLSAYRRILTDALGTPSTTRYRLGQELEFMEVLEFPGNADGRP